MVNRSTVREYVNGSLWVWPTVSAAAALVVGGVVSRIRIPPDSPLSFLAFQGSVSDARDLLAGISGTVVTVIALVLGLTVVALQLASTQFSPRLLAQFLRDRANQVALSVFTATFVYSAAGLFTVGLAGGADINEFPRLGLSIAVLLMLASLGMVVYFADHLAHSIQVDAIGARVERQTLGVLDSGIGDTAGDRPEPPASSIPILAARSGYIQAVRPEELLPPAGRDRLVILLRLRVGEHVVAGTTLAWAWPAGPSTADRQAPAVVAGDAGRDRLAAAVNAAVQVGAQRTLEQDPALGVRQLVDMACKALSPAINDPYTAVQAMDHLSVIFCALAVRPLGDRVVGDPHAGGAVVVPGWRFADYLSTACGLIRRYGAAEPAVAVGLLRLLDTCASVLDGAAHPVPDDDARRAAIAREADLVLADATAQITQPADLGPVRAAADALRARLRPYPTPAEPTEVSPPA